MELLGNLFPRGFGGSDVMAELCPDGWASSSLRLSFHPTPEQQYQEAVRWRENLERFRNLTAKKKPKDESDKNPSPDPPPLEPLPDRETFLAEARARPDVQDEEDGRELGRLVGLCLWDILSDNHDLILPDGRVRHMGSFRATAGLIADFFQRSPSGGKAAAAESWDFRDFAMDYCEFYMGTWAISNRTDLSPVYRLIFERLKALDYGWVYAFPKIGIVRFPKPESANDKPEWENYNPAESLAREQQEAEEEAEFREMERKMEESHRKALEEAKSRPPPLIAQVHSEVFGHWPAGWPPWE